jgi:hypothetical protein
MTTQGTDLLIRESAETYHAKASEYLSSHQLGNFRKCPLLYHRKRIGLIQDEERPAYLVGRAAHTLILEGRARFEAEYAVGGPVNPRTGEPFGTSTKAFAEWAAVQGKPVLTAEQVALVEAMNAGVREHELAVVLLTQGVAEGVCRAEYCGVPCQIRIDYFSPASGGGIVDLKTCDDLTYFEADARRYGYAYQMAFYRAVLAAACRGELFPVHIIAIEKKPPFRCGVWRFHDDALASAQRENEAAIARLRECHAKGEWPSGYEEARVFDFI